MKQSLRYTLILIMIVMAACSWPGGKSDPEDPVVAIAYENKLYLSDVKDIVPVNINGQDSALFVQNYINKWLQQQILFHNARQKLAPNEQDFTRQLEEYRNSLLLYSYEKKLIHENLDTLVDFNEIEAYYRLNRSQFELKGNIVKFDFVKIPANSKRLKDFRLLLKPGSFADSTKLLDYCQNYSTDYWLTREWVFLQDLLDLMPVEPDNEENFLRRTTFLEVKEDEFIYLLRLNDFKTMDSIPPLEFEKENIRNIIINSRKLDLLEQLRQEDIDEAIRNKHAVIFNDPIMQ